MSTKPIAFRCPVELMQRVDAVAAALGTTRSAIITEAVRLLCCEIRARGGRMVQPYSGDELLNEIRIHAGKENESEK